MKNTMKKTLIALSLATAGTLAHADGVRLYGADEIPAAADVAAMLTAAHAPVGRPVMKMRGISLDPAPAPAHSVEDAVAKVAQAPTKAETEFALPIRFAFDSAEILPGTAGQLDAVAEGIRMAGDVTVVVEGHTDAYGRSAYNATLSKRRAQAVQAYLVSHHGIDRERLVIAARGEEAPLNTADPYAPENRRVQFRAAH
jgi:outer membrane protein OmpA-like peptidoglycan-associated protein